MTANPQKPARYRPGKPTTEEASSTSDSDSDSNTDAPPDAAPKPAPPKTSSVPAPTTTKIASTLKEVDLNSIRRRRAALDEEARVEAENAARAKREEEEGFVTEEDDGDNGSEASGSDEGTVSDDEEGEDSSGSDDEEAPKVLLRPTFIRKDQRKDPNPTTTDPSQSAAEQHPTTDPSHRLAKADALIEAQLAKNAAAHAAGKKHWDDDDDTSADHVDDTDALDPPSELAAWKLRELQRVKRSRSAIEAAERERDEIERRRGLSQSAREAEDRAFLAGQREEREGRGKMGYLQKYHHKGAFFQEDARELGLGGRDVMGGRFVDEVRDRELLPRYLQVRDMARVGRKGASKYRDLKSEDTGRWGEVGGGGGVGGVRDERFLPDGRDGGRGGGSGANAMAVRERRIAPEGAPEGPRADRNGSSGRDGREGGDTYRPGHDRGSDDEPRRRSPRRRSHSRLRSRSPSPRRDQHRDHRDRRKRSPSPYRNDHAGDKRRKIDVS